MSSSDLRACSRQLLGSLQRIDALIDALSAGGNAPRAWDDIAAQANAAVDALATAQASLQALAGDGPSASVDPAQARPVIAATVAELPLEPALQVMREVPALVDKARAQPAASGVILVPLCLAHRHCIEAMLPLSAAMDPRELHA